MCGTNNHDHSAEQVTDGILTIVRYIKYYYNNYHYICSPPSDISYIIIIINICFSTHQVVVLMCGTNNHDHSAEQVTDAILTIVRYIKEKQPQATVIVVVSTADYFKFFLSISLIPGHHPSQYIEN